MRKQNYSNHIRYYPPHHFVFLPVMTLLIIWGVRNIFYDSTNQLLWFLFSIVSACILYLAIMLRQHYALGNQDRIVRLEFRLRYYQSFGESSQKVEEQLSFSQLAALRFTDDHEFKSLLDKALKENISSKEIKKRITNWQGDYMRL